jgi:hypothetical protein
MRGVSLLDRTTAQPRSARVRTVSASAACSVGPKPSPVYAVKLAVGGDRVVGRVEVDQIAGAGVGDRGLVVAAQERRVLRSSRGGALEGVGVADRRVLVATHRHVEAAAAC